MKTVKWLFYLLVIIVFFGCSTSKIHTIQYHNDFKIIVIDTATFLDYNFIILENMDDVFYLISKKDSLNSNNYFVDTLKKGETYRFKLRPNQTLKILKLKKTSNAIDGYIYKNQSIWEHDTLMVKTFFSEDIKGILLVKDKSQ